MAKAIYMVVSMNAQKLVSRTASGSVFVLAVSLLAASAGATERPTEDLALGRYLVQTTGCNDCHSPGYGTSGGKTPEATWLTGDRLGWRGPWGTTYPSNLRLYFASRTETQWIDFARNGETRPPMPWFNLRVMSDRDLRAIYRYVRAAGPAGEPAPAYAAPGAKATGPVVLFP